MVLDLARGFRARDHRVTVISLAHDGALSRSFNDIPIVSVDRRPGLDRRLPWRIARILRDLRADVVHTHNPAALTYGVPAARLGKIRTVIHTKHGANPPRSRADLAARRALVRMCDAYVAVSEPTAHVAYRLDRAPEHLLHVIPNGIDTAAYAHRPARRIEVRRQFGIGMDTFVVGTVGRLAREKNHKLLVDAVASFLGPDIQLVIIGDGPERRAIEAAIPVSARSYVHLPGARDDIPAVLSAFDMFALSSTTEGLPLVVPEAMAAGLPVVATRVGGLPAVLRDRITGLLIEPGDRDGLSHAIVELARNREVRRALGEAAVLDARSRFDLGRVLDAYERLYR